MCERTARPAEQTPEQEAHLVVWRCACQARQVLVLRELLVLELRSKLAPGLLQGELVLQAHLALGDVLDGGVGHLVAHLHGQVVLEVEQAHLAHVLGFRHLLADDGGLVARVAAGAPPKLGVRALADVALGAVLHLHGGGVLLVGDRSGSSWCGPAARLDACSTSHVQHKGGCVATEASAASAACSHEQASQSARAPHPLHPHVRVRAQARLAYDGKVAALPAILVGVMQEPVRHGVRSASSQHAQSGQTRACDTANRQADCRSCGAAARPSVASMRVARRENSSDLSRRVAASRPTTPQGSRHPVFSSFQSFVKPSHRLTAQDSDMQA